MIAATFWFIKFDNNVTILQALLDTGRYPSTVYPFWLRLIVTFVVPIAVATTVPLQALRGELGPLADPAVSGDQRGQFPGCLQGLESRGEKIRRRFQLNKRELGIYPEIVIKYFSDRFLLCTILHSHFTCVLMIVVDWHRIDVIVIHQCIVPALAGADADHFLDRVDKDDPIALIAGSRSLDDGLRPFFRRCDH